MLHYSNFSLYAEVGEGLERIFYATVYEVETSWFRGRRFTIRKIFKEYFSTWRFLDTGEYTLYAVDQLALAYKAQQLEPK